MAVLRRQQKSNCNRLIRPQQACDMSESSSKIKEQEVAGKLKKLLSFVQAAIRGPEQKLEIQVLGKG